MKFVLDKTSEINSARELKKRDLEKAKAAVLKAGFLYEENTFDVCENSEALIRSNLALLKSGIKSPHGGFWRSNANVNVQMDDGVAIDFFSNALEFSFKVRSEAWGKKAAIESLQSTIEINALDVTRGWPK